MDYDVMIAGGSFAGLAVAAGLRGRRVLVVEPHEIGTVQTSACGTLLAVLEATGTMESLLQVHDKLVLHFSHRIVEYPLPYSFCTFDYRTFCQRLHEQGDAEILQASVLGHHGHTVLTTRGAFTASILIDASGWRAALASNAQRQNQPHQGKSFGLETTIPISDQGLHFYYDPGRLQPYNIGWLFPVGASSRAGLGSYRGQSRMNESLKSFVNAQFNVPTDGRHGGYFPYRGQRATTGPVFRVGDSAGQCIPLTGEGIRPAVYFGAVVARLAQKVLTGELTEQEAMTMYHKFVERHRVGYRFLLAAQKILPGLPIPWTEHLAGMIRSPEILVPLLQLYLEMANPREFVNNPKFPGTQPIGKQLGIQVSTSQHRAKS
jgi:flavin-dependent dehydrogenase